MTPSLAEATAAARRITDNANERVVAPGWLVSDAHVLAGFVLAGDTERLREALACAKCGGIDIQTRHHLGASYWGDARHCANGSAVHPGAHRSDEHLHRTCQTCRFDWVEDALVEGNP